MKSEVHSSVPKSWSLSPILLTVHNEIDVQFRLKQGATSWVAQQKCEANGIILPTPG
jgi:hypothetical protein